jgi:hypothetical protein
VGKKIEGNFPGRVQLVEDLFRAGIITTTKEYFKALTEDEFLTKCVNLHSKKRKAKINLP